MLVAIMRLLISINTILLRIGRNVAWVALALMVFVILLQVFFRYILNNALNWPDEAARFLMLWMTGLIAPSAFRWGGFVAIDMLPLALPKKSGLILTLFLFMLSATVLWVGLGLGWGHAMGFGGKFDSASLRLPLDLIGGETVKVKLRYMYGSLLVGVFLLFLVNIELILRTIFALFKPDLELPTDAPAVSMETD